MCERGVVEYLEAEPVENKIVRSGCHAMVGVGASARASAGFSLDRPSSARFIQRTSETGAGVAAAAQAGEEERNGRGEDYFVVKESTAMEATAAVRAHTGPCSE